MSAVHLRTTPSGEHSNFMLEEPKLTLPLKLNLITFCNFFDIQAQICWIFSPFKDGTLGSIISLMSLRHIAKYKQIRTSAPTVTLKRIKMCYCKSLQALFMLFTCMEIVVRNISTHWCHHYGLSGSLEEKSQASSSCIVQLDPLLSWQHKTQSGEHKASGVRMRAAAASSAKTLPHSSSHFTTRGEAKQIH